MPRPPCSRVAPLAPERFALQVTISRTTHEKLRWAEELLGHALPSGDVAQVPERALDEPISKLEQRKFAASARSQPRRSHANERYVPTAVRREVYRRDAGRCTFTSHRGHRCEARRALEFDHVVPLARGGATSTGNRRLRCRAHNQHEADRAFGKGFVDRKRLQADAERPARCLRPIQQDRAGVNPANGTG